MLINKFNTTECINGCKIFNDNSNYLYWENKSVTIDEIDILAFLKSKSDKKNGLDKKISKLSDALEKSKAKDAKKGKVSKKTKILQKAVDKLTNK